MKETIITNIIPKTHRYILFGLFFTFFLGFFTFIALLEGIHFDHLSFNGFKIEKLYLKWENALLIRAEKVDLSALQSDNLPLNLKPLGKLPPLIRHTQRWVKQIDINTIQYNSIKLSLQYHKNSPGIITLFDGNSSYNGIFTLNENFFNLSLLHGAINSAKISGNLSVELPQQRLNMNIRLNLPQTPTLFINASGNTDSLMFTLHINEPLRSVQSIIEFLNIDPEIRPWITQYAKASLIKLQRFEGKFHYNNPEELLNALHAEATIKNGEYTFAMGFEPIYAPQINLIFRQGKLEIIPYNGRFYNLPTEASRLRIDFTTPHSELDIHLETKHAVLNEPILKLLRFYDIDIPIQQTSGICDVDLDLNINLHDLKTTAKGIFRPSSTELLIHSIPLYSDGGIVKLNNAEVRFENFTAHYGDDVAHAKVNGEYDTKTRYGSVRIEAYDVAPLSNKTFLHLSNPKSPLHLTYFISPKGDFIQVMPSTWDLMGERLVIEKFQAPFNYSKITSSIQSVPFSLSNTVYGKVSALFDGTKKQTDIQITLNSFKLGEIQLSHTPLTLDIHKDNNLTTLHSTQSSAWSIHQLPLLLSPFSASIKKDQITFEPIEAILGDLLKGHFSGQYSLATLKGNIRINSMMPISPKLSPMIDTQESLQLLLDTSGQEIILDADSLKTKFSTIPNGWKITLDDISLLSKHSPILRRYHINKGNLNLYYTPKSSRYTFDGLIHYPYPLMIINAKPISKYHFSGTYQENQSSIRVNDRIIINRYADKIDIKTKNMGINLPQLLELLSIQRQKNTTTIKNEEIELPLYLHADNTYLYLTKERRILSDRMEALLNNENLEVSLHHMNGIAKLKIYHELFHIDGKGFNDKFMEHLFALSDFSEGEFSFQAKGEAEAFEGVMRVEHTILKDYKVLNNILAFINTVPSLATFSLPNYNTKGLPVREGYAHFSYSGGVIKVDNFTLNSPEMKILGEGYADMKSNTLNGTLTLKTDLGSSLGKLPMLGYILFGDDGSISTNLTLSGKFDNPIVETAIAQEIVTAPFNILKRTVAYPFLWIGEDKKKK
ncbi:AsmA-like C-terminal domain-containing protein [Sulfuricurvum sp.]|uniref:YhdP family protein n=1 Tax=Sulfuricurvum sp. TaxID=2025608 RepID=UPI003BB61B6A